MENAYEEHIKHCKKDKTYRKKWPEPERITAQQLQVIAQRIKDEKPLFRDIKPPVERTMVTNPETGRRVVVGTRTYEKLVKEGKIQPPNQSTVTSIGTQTEECIPVENEVPRILLPKGKMSTRQKAELICNGAKLKEQWEMFCKVDPRSMDADTRLYLINLLDACIYFCQKHRVSIKVLCDDGILSERIFTWVNGLELYTPMMNRCKRYLEEMKGKYVTTEVNRERRKVPRKQVKKLRQIDRGV